MGNRSMQPLPTDVLLGLLPATFEPWGSSPMYKARPPTRDSVQRIEAQLGITIPPLFIDVAAACSSYGGWFNSIGDDFASHMHVTTLNRSFWDLGLARRYVLLIHGHDGDCDAWDTEAPLALGERPIVYFNYDTDRKLFRGLRPSAFFFADYIDKLVRAKAPKCPVQALRRHAKQVLAEFGPPEVA
jgi:hypothetical protein